MREPKYQKVLEPLIFIYKRPYWRRLWIIQELLSKPVTVMHIGLRVLPFDPLMVIGPLVRKNIRDNPGILRHLNGSAEGHAKQTYCRRQM
jgi:hypothetical protein